MEKQYFDFKILKSDKGEVTIVASDETLDRMGEVVPIDTWDLKNYKKNPVLLVDHDYKVEKIVGRAKNIVVDQKSKQMTFTPEFHGLTQLAKEVEAMVMSDFAPAVSVGFLPHGPAKDGDKGHNELLEISFVSVPANPNALALAMKSIDDKQIAEVKSWVEEKNKDVVDNDKLDNEKGIVTMTKEFADDLAKSIDELAELKEGRVLSGKNRTKITECSTALKQAADLLDDLLQATDSAKAGSVDQKVEKAKVEHEARVPKKAASPVVRALQDANKMTNILLSELKN